jgi:hypothetical protein
MMRNAPAYSIFFYKGKWQVTLNYDMNLDNKRHQPNFN